MKRYFTGRPCKNGHIAERIVSNGVCLDCQLATNERGRARDPERFVRYSRDTGLRFAKAHPGYGAAKRKQHGHKHVEARRRWLQVNAARVRAINRNWKRRNPEWSRAAAERRRQSLAAAAPWWLTQDHRDAMAAIYHEARRRGPGWHVDHIVPLNGATVCGLHVPWNLQILPAAENIRKGNRLTAA